jgi:hypothetical protein
MCLADKIDSSDAGEKKKVRKILLRVRKKQSEILNKKSFKTIILIVILLISINLRYMGTMGEGWTAFRLQRLGQWNEANTRTFPLTTEIIRGLNIPLAVRGVMFAKQVQSCQS